MSFFRSSTFAKPRSRKQTVVSEKWTRLGEPKKPSKGLRKVGKKGDFWLFVSQILNKFCLKIGLPKRCEIQGAFCDNYHLTPAHTRRRQDIRVGDWWYALRVVTACTECHFEVDAKGRREAEPILEDIILARFKRLGLTEDQVKQLLLECAEEIQGENDRFSTYVVTF